MKRLLTLASLALLLVSFSFAQKPSKQERARRSTEILAKVRRIDLLNQILPVAMTKKQINQLLGALEKTQADVEKKLESEYEAMLKQEPDLDKTIRAGIEKGELPSHDYVVRLSKFFNALDITRQLAIGENLETVRSVMTKVLNAGQIKAAENCIDATFFDPSLKPADLTDAKKLDTYIKVVILDPEAYKLLTEMFKAAKD